MLVCFRMFPADLAKDRPRAKWFFVDALFPRTSEVWWLVLGCTRAPRGLNPWNQGALKQTQPVDAREGDTW